LSAIFYHLVEKLKDKKIHRNIVNGDAHLGNFLYDKEADRVSIVDYAAICRSVDQEGNPIWHGPFDFMDIVDIIGLAKDRGLSDEEYSAFKGAFYRGYDKPFADVEEEFFLLVARLRRVGFLLSKVRENPEKPYNEKIKQISKYRIKMLKKAAVSFASAASK